MLQLERLAKEDLLGASRETLTFWRPAMMIQNDDNGEVVMMKNDGSGQDEG